MKLFYSEKEVLVVILLFSLAVALGFFLAFVQKSHAFDLSVTGNQVMLNSENLDPSRGVLLEAGNLWRVSLSFEDTLLRFGGQETCDIRLYRPGSSQADANRRRHVRPGRGIFYTGGQEAGAVSGRHVAGDQSYLSGGEPFEF